MTLPLDLTAMRFLQEEAAPPYAPAQNTAEESSGGLGDLLVPMLLIIGIFYVIVILPERKKKKEREAMLKKMQKGDRVMTSSGIYGSIAQVQEEVVTLQVADGVRMRFNRASIQSILSDDEEKGAKK